MTKVAWKVFPLRTFLLHLSFAPFFLPDERFQRNVGKTPSINPSIHPSIQPRSVNSIWAAAASEVSCPATATRPSCQVIKSWQLSPRVSSVNRIWAAAGTNDGQDRQVHEGVDRGHLKEDGDNIESSNLQRVSLSEGRCEVSGKQRHGKDTSKVIKEWSVAVSAETEP
jgi:hypothetical protein